MAHLSTAQRRVTIIRYRCAYSARSDVHTQHAAHICGHKYLFVCSPARACVFLCTSACEMRSPMSLAWVISHSLSLVLSVRLSVCRWHWRGTPKCSRVYAFVCVNDLSSVRRSRTIICNVCCYLWVRLRRCVRMCLRFTAIQHTRAREMCDAGARTHARTHS